MPLALFVAQPPLQVRGLNAKQPDADAGELVGFAQRDPRLHFSGPNAELLFKLAVEGLLGAFAPLDLAARKLPIARVDFPQGPGGRQNALAVA